MKKIAVIFPILLLLLSVNSCDFFRTVAGRPTSAQIEMKAARLAEEQREAAEKAFKDSVAAATVEDKELQSVIEAVENGSIKLQNSTNILSSQSSGQKGYYVMVGAFGNPSNADRLASKISSSGEKAVLIRYKNGMVAVGVNPTESLVEAANTLSRLQKAGLAPNDAWILDNR